MSWTLWAEMVPAVLDALAEGAWIAVFYRLMAIAADERPTFGLPSLALVVAGGLILGRLLRARAGDAPSGSLPGRSSGSPLGGSVAPRASAVALALAIAAATAIAGWLASPGVREALTRTDLAAAVSRHPGGWLVGLAVLRGLAHAGSGDVEASAVRGIRLGLPILIVVWLAGSLVAPAQQPAFRGDALPNTVVFMVAGLLGLGLDGLRAQARLGGFDWRANRGAPALLTVVVGLMVVLAVPAALVLGQPLIELLLALARPAIGVVLLILLIRTAPRAVAFAGPWAALAFAIVIFFRLLGVEPADVAKTVQQLQQALQLTPPPDSGGSTGDLPAITAWLVAIAAAGVLVLIVRAWLRRRAAAMAADVFEERSVVLEATRVRWPRLSLGWRQRLAMPRPGDAVSAYRAALTALAMDPDLRRGAAESPAEHGARLRDWDPAGAPLRRLAADYELARFGGRELSGREEARALRRWQRVREAVHRR